MGILRKVYISCISLFLIIFVSFNAWEAYTTRGIVSPKKKAKVDVTPLHITIADQVQSVSSQRTNPYAGNSTSSHDAEEACKFVDCGHGICSSNNSLPFFNCECFPGWTKLKIGRILVSPSCVILKCSVKFNCPMPWLLPMFFPTNLSNPCNLFWCGDGSCEANSGGGHKCNCNAGAFNLQNKTSMPCFQECNLGPDCNGLGLVLPPPFTLDAPPPSVLPSPQPSLGSSPEYSYRHQYLDSSSSQGSTQQKIGALACMLFLMSLHFAI